MIIVFLVLFVLAFAIVITNIYVVQQSRAYVVERLGAFHNVWGVGLHFKVPFIDRVARRVSLKEQVLDYPPQPVITKDNVTMQIDTVVFFQITDPKLYAYGVENPISAIENLTATTLRNIIGELELDHTLTSRDTINAKIRGILDEATDPWGIKVNRVELKNILPPPEIQDAMEKQMKAERERREAILIAEGEKRSTMRDERLSPSPLQSLNFSSGKSGVRNSKLMRLRTCCGSHPFIFVTSASGKNFSPSLGGRTKPSTTSPVFSPQRFICCRLTCTSSGEGR